MSHTIPQVRIALAESFIRSGFVGEGAGGHTPAGSADKSAAIFAILNPQAAMNNAVLGEGLSDMAEIWRREAQCQADFWISHISEGILLGRQKQDAKQASKRYVVEVPRNTKIRHAVARSGN